MKIHKLLAPLMALILLAGCGTKSKPDDAAVRVAALKGPTAMGMVRLMEQSDTGKATQDYEFTLGVIDEILPLVSRGDIDIAAVPANLSAVLYNNLDGAVRVAAINTLGVLYVTEKGESVFSVSDLKGKTVYSTGKGATPEFALNYVLRQNGLDPDKDLTIEYRSEPAEILPLLEQSKDGVALLPQPFVASALKKITGLRVALDLTAEWDAVSDGGGLVTGVLIVSAEFADKRPEALAAFLEEYAASTRYANESAEETAELIEKYGIISADIARDALPYCNITCVTGTEMRDVLSGYLGELYRQNPDSVGGALPDDAFYYGT